jgi:hypothetical protein
MIVAEGVGLRMDYWNRFVQSGSATPATMLTVTDWHSFRKELLDCLY